MTDTVNQTELPDSNTAEPGLREVLSSIPTKPGVYLMRNADGEIIYIGKALNLKKRISSYLKPPGRSDGKTSVLIKKIADVETIITASEKEALILESNLIKQHRPRYNVDLKDDKRYPLLRLNTTHPYPKLSIVRKTKKDGALYFGPYASAGAVRQTLKIINKAFKLRKCSDREFKIRTRPCLNCQMQGCLAPCCRDIDKAHYDEMVKEVILFLKGRRSDLVRKIKKQMQAAAEQQEYEKAAGLRDKMFALEKTIEGQVAVSADLKDRDVIATARTPELSLVVQLFVRGGYLLGSRNFTFTETMANDAEIVGSFIRQHYGSAKFIPLEILIPVVLEDAHLIEGELSGLKGRKVHLRRPFRGQKAQLLKMAQNNAEKDLVTLLDARSKSADILTRLQKRLKLPALPERIECFDNSNISGTLPVASMVVFSNGAPDRSSYRKYKLKNVNRPDDYAYMNEVLRRRYGKGHASEPLPDLLILDGGKGQLGVASAVIQDLQLAARFEMIGIAKKDEQRGEKQDKIYRPGRANPIQFGRDTDLLFFIQRIRDEAHRFAITYHRKRRNRQALASALDPIPGIGKKKKELLLKHFKSIDKIRDATLEALSGLPGINHRLAGVIKERLARS
jgi:excinuclease ABC subunit C